MGNKTTMASPELVSFNMWPHFRPQHKTSVHDKDQELREAVTILVAWMGAIRECSCSEVGQVG